MGKRIVICLDGTGNQPKSGETNVRRLYDMLVKDDTQITYYDPGVGTLAAPTASNRFQKWTTRLGGLVFGHGVKINVAQAYEFLAEVWEPDDRIFIFGFSRGAYTARALTGLLRTIGLLRPELSSNLTDYALDIYTDKGLPDIPDGLSKEDKGKLEQKKHEWWGDRADWEKSFANPRFPSRFDWAQVHFLGIWDTVKFVGWFNFKAQFEEAKWPFTRELANVAHSRHALSIDERRKKYEEYRIDTDLVVDDRRDVREVWFAGVHSDVGGTFKDDPRLANISLKWMIDEATANGLKGGTTPSSGSDASALDVLGVDPKQYKDILDLSWGAERPPDWVLGKMHPAGWVWRLTGPGWRSRPIKPGDEVHQSVFDRIQALQESQDHANYTPDMPSDVVVALD